MKIIKAKVLFSTVLTLSLGLLSGCGIQSIPQQKNEVEASWADVLAQYQRRADLIPNLVEAVKGYSKHEAQTLQNVVEARAKATQNQIKFDQLNPDTIKQFQEAQAGLAGALSRLMVVAEQYPDLKANQNFRDLQVQLEGTENRITISRQRFIESVKNFNNLVTVFPTNLTNSVFFKFEKMPQFTVENEKELQKAPEVKF
jgi:LemA protein